MASRWRYQWKKVAFCLAAAASFAVGSARASTEEDKDASAPAKTDAAVAPAPAPVRADNARGWETPPNDDGIDAALFLPRLILVPPRLVVETVFWPIEHGLRFVERHAVLDRIEHVLYFDDAKTKGILPVISFSSSQGPTAGVHVFDHDIAGHEEKLDVSAAFGGLYSQAYQVGFSADRFLGSHVWLETLSRFEADRNLIFEGYGDAPAGKTATNLGPRETAIETRYRENRFLNLVRLGYTFGKKGSMLKLGATAIENHRDFAPAYGQAEPPINAYYDTAQLKGFDQGVHTLELDGNVIVDLLENEGAKGGGFYFDGFGGAVPQIDGYRYGHYGAEASVYIDLYKKTRVLVIRAVHEAVVGKLDEIPFSDLPRLGGPHRLRGFELDRFRDKTSAVGTIEYHYPIHDSVSGSLFMDAGHVGPDYEKLMKLKDWHLGGGGGFIFHVQDRILFTLDVAYGDGVQVYLTTDPLRAFAKREQQL